MRTRDFCLFLLSVSSASGLLNSCTTEEPWPPFSDWVASAFHDNREEFTELEVKLLESKYSAVYLLGETGAYGKYVEAGAVEEERIEPDGQVWAKLLVATKMLRVSRIDAGTVFSTGINPFVTAGDTEISMVGRLLVIHSESLLTAADRCDDSHRQLPDGECYLPLSDGWGALYSWTTM